MESDKKPPVFLDLLLIHKPVSALLSIGHRISGALLFLSIPFLIYLLDLSLQSSAGFEQVAAILDGWFAKMIGFVVIWCVTHHLLSGIRFLLLDIEVGIERDHALASARAVFIAGAVLTFIFSAVILF
ncbi:MAG: succinate dehydrogenase, cytochrome b556 subunit [Gammaproteobacteria bacterium]|nr:succinate dehydrogenase, cytochrome b556 subunit [Gammaproteobacteria bacterium]